MWKELKTRKSAMMTSILWEDAVCDYCAAGCSLLGLMTSIWVIFPLVPNEEEETEHFSIMGWQNKHMHEINMQTKNRLRINARATREAAWRMGPMFVLGGTASDHVSKPSEQPWAALFIPQQRSLLRPGAFCLIQHRDQNKFTASVSKQLSVQKCCCVASIPIA